MNTRFSCKLPSIDFYSFTVCCLTGRVGVYWPKQNIKVIDGIKTSLLFSAAKNVIQFLKIC